MPNENRRYTKKDVDFLTSNFGKMTIEQMAESLGRTYHAVHRKLQSLGLKKRSLKAFSIEDEEYLIRNGKTLPVRVMADFLGRKEDAIRGKLYQMRIKKKESFRWWEPDELELLEANYLEVSDRELAEKLDRSAWSVRSKRRHLGLMTTVHTRWTPEEDAHLRRMVGKQTIKATGKQLGRTKTSVEKRVRRLGIKWMESVVTLTDIARALHISTSTVHRYLSEFGEKETGFKGGRGGIYTINTSVVAKIAQAILESPIATNRCHASLKRLERAAAGDWSIEGSPDKKPPPNREDISKLASDYLVDWENV